MRPYKSEKIETLPDIFYALMEGKPDDLSEIKEFLKHSRLNKLLFATDIDNILHYDGYFGEDNMINAVYSLLPITFSLKDGKKFNLLPTSFRNMNLQIAQKPASRMINLDFGKVMQVYLQDYTPKMRAVIRDKKKYQSQNQKEKNPDAAKNAYRRRQQKMTEEEKAIEREKKRIKMQQYRAEHPEKRKSYHKKVETLSPLQQIQRREDNRRRNRKYRKNNREDINARNNLRRAKIKEENPELLKELDKQHNMTESRKKAGRNYYQNHKEEIDRKAKENPMVKIYKQRYKRKKRFQEKTGVTILNLLQGIINAKSK